MNRITVACFLGTHEDWGGASRALLNFARRVDRERFAPLVVMPTRGTLAGRLQEEGIGYRIWPKHDRSRNVPAYVAAILKAIKFFRENHVDLIHINYGSIGWKPAEVLAARMLRIPVIMHYHITVREPTSYLRYAAGLITVSQYIADASETRSVPVTVVHNISDIGRFGRGCDIRTELGIPAGHRVVSFIGQIKPIKGLDTFVEMAGLIDEPDVSFLVAGDLRDTPDAYAKEDFEALMRKDQRLRYVGYRTDAENLYASSDIVMMPSRWEEPCAMVVFEAGAAGKPLIATRTGGTPEIVEHGRTGFLVERDDAVQMASYARQLLADEGLRHTLGANARDLMASRFATEPVRKLEALYQSLAAERG